MGCQVNQGSLYSISLAISTNPGPEQGKGTLWIPFLPRTSRRLFAGWVCFVLGLGPQPIAACPIARWFPRQSRPKRAVVPLVSCSSRRKMGVPGTERQSQFPNSKPIRAQLQQNDGNLASPTAHQHVHEFIQIYSPYDDSTFISWIS